MRRTNFGWTDPLRRATRTLRFKMTVGVTSFIVMISVLLSTLFVMYLGSSEEAASRRLVEDATVVLSATISEEVMARDPDGIRDRLTGFLTDSRILYVVVSTPDGELIRIVDSCPDDLVAHVNSPATPARLFHARPLPNGPDGRRLEVAVPVQSPAPDRQPMGAVRVGYSMSAASQRVEELQWRIAMITFAMMVMGTGGTMFLVGRVIGPIQELARGTESIADGDLDVHVSEESDDEVGVLARSFNRMTERLRTAMNLEREFSRDLEQRVQEKTREIGETREHLSNIVENVGASILVADLDGTVISANTHTMHIFGTKPEFTVGRALDEFACGVRVEDLLGRLEESGGPVVYDARFSLKGQHEMDLLITHTLLRDTRGRAAGILQITKDITTLRRMERRLVSSERLSAMGEMAGEIGHELNNYLMAIGGRAELITVALSRGSDSRSLAKVDRSAKIIADQVAEMRRLTDGLLDSAQKETAPQEFDLNELVRSTVEFVRPQNRFDGIQFVLGIADQALPVLADPQQIRQVLLNLLANGADATKERTPDGGNLRVGTFADGDRVGFRVEDHGVGISAETRGRIFEPHFTTKPTGHGFGLAVCYRVVQNHGGAIEVESTPGAGATFTVRLPKEARKPAAASERGVPGAAP